MFSIKNYWKNYTNNEFPNKSAYKHSLALIIFNEFHKRKKELCRKIFLVEIQLNFGFESEELELKKLRILIGFLIEFFY